MSLSVSLVVLSCSLLAAEGSLTEVVYKTAPRPLTYQMYQPAGEASSPRGAVVFFHGGGWNAGGPGQFASHCQRLAEQGVVGISVSYRLRKTDGTPATACVVDAWDAWQHLLDHAADYNIATDRIAVGGGSAGGHLAACLGTGTTAPGDDAETSKRPCAMVLFNPAVCLAPFEGYVPLGFEKTTETRVGCAPEKLSPLHFVDKSTPPTLIMHGTADTTVGIRSVALFRERLQQYGTQAGLKRYVDQGHGFFNKGRGEAYEQTVEQMLEFLTETGVIETGVIGAAPGE